MTGDGVRKNNDRAFSLFLSAAEAGNDKAQYFLGVCYRSGVGTEKDKFRAAQWFWKAYGQENRDAENALHDLLSLSPPPPSPREPSKPEEF